MTKYGTLIDNILHPAPRAFMLHGAMVTNPKAEHFAALNVERAKDGLPPYLPLVDERPTTDAAHYAVPTGWTRDGETWRRVYEVREVPPPPPRTFSKLRIEDALFHAGVLDAADAFIDAQTITNEHGQTMPLRRKYQTANDFSEAHPLFAQFKAALQTELGWTDEQVEAVLAASVKE